MIVGNARPIWMARTGVSYEEENLAHAKDFAQDWYLELVGKSRAGVLKAGKTFKQAADQFLMEYEVITEGGRHRQYIESSTAYSGFI